MEKNFKLPDSISVAINGKLLDLHNDFCLSSVQYITGDESMLMTWKPTQFCNDNTIARLEIVFSSIKKLSANITGLGEEAIISFIGYNYEKDFGQSRYFVSEQDSKAEQGITFAFEGGSSISINAIKAFAAVICHSDTALI
jgi:hypothetical protein